MQYNQAYNIQYSLGGGNKATKACLIRLGAVTHGFDQDQRRVPLTITGSETVPPSLEQLTVKAPLNGNIAPPGYYMLFILGEYKVNEFAPCSEARHVKVGP